MISIHTEKKKKGKKDISEIVRWNDEIHRRNTFFHFNDTDRYFNKDRITNGSTIYLPLGNEYYRCKKNEKHIENGITSSSSE